jgi:hypothetical protein
MDGVNSSVEITWQPGDRKGKITLVAKPSTGDPFTDSVNIVSQRSRDKYADSLCEKFTGLNRSVVESELDRIATEVAQSQRPPEHAGAEKSRDELLAEADAATVAALEAMDEDALAEAEALLRDPLLIDRVLDAITRVGVVGEESLALLMYILGTSRLLDEPLAAIIQGASSSGKSFIPSRVSKLFPREALFVATDITANALYYGPPDALIHKWVVGGERRRGNDDDNAEATRALREMISERELNKTVPVKNPDGSGFVSLVIHRDGPIAFTESTTLTQIFDEDANRCLLLSTDETQDQTTRVVFAQAEFACGEVTDCEPVRLVHHAIQRLLKRVKVRVPFAKALARAIPKDAQEARRAMNLVLNTIRAIALLHQFPRLGRAPAHGDLILATADDYAVARRLLAGPMGRSLGGALPDAVVRFGHRLAEEFARQVFTSNEVVTRLGMSKGKVNEYLGTLAEKGVTECIEAGRGSKPAKWQIVDDVPEGGADWLPRPEEIDPEFVPALRFLKSGAAGQQAGNARNHAGNAAPTPLGSLGGSSGSNEVATPVAPKLPQGAGGSNSPANSAESGLLPRDPAGPRVACNVPGHTRGWRPSGSTSQVMTCGLCHPPASLEPVEWVDSDDADGGGVVI